MKFLILLVVLGLITMGNCIAIPEPYAFAEIVSAETFAAASTVTSAATSAATTEATTTSISSGDWPCGALDPSYNNWDTILILGYMMPFAKP